MKQDQRGGENSTNIQAGSVTIIQGPSIEDVRAIAVQVWRENMPALAEVAKQTASARAEEIVEGVISGIADGKGSPEGFQHPEKQLALFDAQKGFAKSGDDKLRKDLIAALLSMSNEPERSMSAIVLHEAITVLPALSHRQVAAIAAAFVIRFVTFNGCGSLEALFATWQKFADLSAGPPSAGDQRHLDYCGCASRTVFGAGVVAILKNIYPGLVAVGLTMDQLKGQLGPVELPLGAIVPNLADPTRFQIAGVNAHVFSKKFPDLTPEQSEAALRVLKDNTLGDDEIISRAKLMGEFPRLVFTDWAAWLGSVELTSVGMAVGHCRATAVDPKFAALDIWLN